MPRNLSQSVFPVSFRSMPVVIFLFSCLGALFPTPATGTKLSLPPETPAILDKIYAFDLDVATEQARRMQKQQPDHPLGFLLEAEALWWKIWCTSADFKYGMSDARHRAKHASDQHYLELAAKIYALAEAQIHQQDSAEMEFYAGMGDAAAARLYGLRGENRNTAKAGVRAREHFLRASKLDPDLADADFGLGLYNYYVDTLNTVAKMLRFFMGIPGGSKQQGIRELEHDIAAGDLTPDVARIYLALNLHRYDQQYERALSVLAPLADRYPANPLLQLMRGDLLAKLGRKEQARAAYHAAINSSKGDAECRSRIQDLAQAALAAIP